MADNVLGLLFEISADPSKAQQALETFEKSSRVELEKVSGHFLGLARSSGKILGLLKGSLKDVQAEQEKLDKELVQHIPQLPKWASGARAVTAELKQVRHQLHDVSLQLLSTGRTARGLRAEFIGTFQLAFRPQLKLAREDLASWTKDFKVQIGFAELALVELREVGRETMLQMSQAMGANIAQAILYGKSIGGAMQHALKAVSASISAQALIQAVYSTALGFLRLAEFDFPAAAAAFEAAAVFGAIGGVTAAIGAAIPGGESLRGGRVRGPGGLEGRGFSPAAGAAAGGPSQALAPGSAPHAPSGNLTVLVMGEASAASWLVNVINSGVVQHDLKLIASHTKRSAPARG